MEANIGAGAAGAMVDAMAVINKLVEDIGQLHLQIAVLKAQMDKLIKDNQKEAEGK